MPARSTWKGYLKVTLLSIPVKAYSASASGGGGIHLNQLHAECHSRIKYKKVCPIHGEVSNDQIVSGYEHAKDQYVVVDTDELDKLRTEDEKAVNIKEFIADDELDPILLTDKTYYLVPNGTVGQRPYAVLYQGMIEQKSDAIAQVVWHGKEQTVLLRPMEGLLAMTILRYGDEVSSPSAFEDEVPKFEIADQEKKLVTSLIDALTEKKFDFSKYKDVYTDKLTKLIEAKVAGEELVVAPEKEESQIINLMDALKQSVDKLKQGEEKPEPKAAPSKKAKSQPSRKKKSS